MGWGKYYARLKIHGNTQNEQTNYVHRSLFLWTRTHKMSTSGRKNNASMELLGVDPGSIKAPGFFPLSRSGSNYIAHGFNREGNILGMPTYVPFSLSRKRVRRTVIGGSDPKAIPLFTYPLMYLAYLRVTLTDKPAETTRVTQGAAPHVLKLHDKKTKSPCSANAAFCCQYRAY